MVLVGDPEQLGPVLRSPLAIQLVVVVVIVVVVVVAVVVVVVVQSKPLDITLLNNFLSQSAYCHIYCWHFL